MAIEYSLEVGEPVTAVQLGEVLARSIAAAGLAEDPPRSTGERFDQTLDSWVIVVSKANGPLPFPDPVEEVFGFTPPVSVHFRFQGQDDLAQERDMIRLVTAVLNTFPGDMWLAFAHEITYLVRTKGRLIVDAARDFWNPELIAMLPAHEVAALPNM